MDQLQAERLAAWLITPKVLTREQVAARLGHCLSWFTQNRTRLELEHGFPPALRGLRCRWDPLAIDAWISGTAPAQRAIAYEGGQPIEDDIAAWQAKLDARAAKLGRAA